MWEGSQSPAVLGPRRQGKEVARRARPAHASPALLPSDARRGAPLRPSVGPRAPASGAAGDDVRGWVGAEGERESDHHAASYSLFLKTTTKLQLGFLDLNTARPKKIKHQASLHLWGCPPRPPDPLLQEGPVEHQQRRDGLEHRLVALSPAPVAPLGRCLLPRGVRGRQCLSF